ncbi:MAG: penicillin-binding transpeptidase domain-containing protein, partial [Bacteroidota bacterium]
ALDQGIEPCDYYPNELRTYQSYKDWTPKNANNEYGGYIPMKTALTHSINTVSVQLLFEAGLPKVVKTAKALGINSPLNEVPSIVLGTSDISLFDMVNAYATIANDGVKRPLRAITKIEDQNGNVLFEQSFEEEEEIDIDHDKIQLLKSMMKNVMQEGTGRRLYANYDIPYTIMGKTGTTQNQSDGWFIGFSEDLVIGSWVGTHDRRIHFRNLGTGSGGRTALPMVAALFEYVASTGNYANEPFEENIIYECPDVLTDEEYAYLQKYLEKQSAEANEDIYSDLQNEIEKEQRKEASRQRRAEERERVQKEREKRMKQIEKEKKKWERKLERLRKKAERKRRRN